MELGLSVAGDHWRVGSPDLLHAFFATISERLEPSGWGTRFPALMHDLYYGELGPDRVETALSELLLARRELGLADPSACFYTDQGRNVFDVVLTALMRLRTGVGEALRIVDSGYAISIT